MKTISLKKVSAVAVASLGFGVLASISPAQAAVTDLTVTIGTVEYGDSKTVPTVGSTVTVPVNLATTAGTNSAVNKVIGTLTTIPNNSALTSTSVSASATGVASAWSASVSVAVSATSNYLQFTENATGAAKSGQIGTVTITPDVPGKYVLTLTADQGGTAATATAGLKTVEINVGGVALTQGNANLGKASTGTQIVGRLSTVTFNVPSGVSAGTKYEITSTLPINNIYSGTANLGAGVAAHTANTGILTVNGVNYTNGGVYTTQANTTTSTALSTANYPAAMEQVSVQVQSPTSAGTHYVYFKSIGATTGALTTVGTATITYGSADLLTLSVANTTIYKAKNNDAPSVSTDPTAIVADATVGAQRANILVTIKNGNDTELFGQTVVASLAGPGLIAWNSSATGSGTARGSVSYTMGSSENVEYLVVNGDGSGGVATITFTIGTTVLGTETITFYGAAKNLAVTVNDAYLDNAGGAAAGAVFVKVTDAQGVVVPSATVYAKSADTAKVTVASTATTAASATTVTTLGGGAGVAQAVGTASFTVTPISAARGAVVLTFGLDALYATSATATVNIVDDVAVTATMALDKTTYTAGSTATLTITAKDVNGDPVADLASSTDFLAAACTPSLSVSSAIFGTAVKFEDGKAVATFFMPATAAPFTVSCKLGAAANEVGTLIAGTTLTASATVTDSTAAIQTSIAALNAKIVALNALIAKIMKRLNIR